MDSSFWFCPARQERKLLNLAQKLSTGQRGSIAGLPWSFEADDKATLCYEFLARLILNDRNGRK